MDSEFDTQCYSGVSSIRNNRLISFHPENELVTCMSESMDSEPGYLCESLRAHSLYFTVDDSSDELKLGLTRKKN